jgi:hypothetical protein
MTAAGAVAGARRSPNARHLLVVGIAYATARVVITGALALGTRFTQGRPMLDGLNSWDSGFYLSIARHGYPHDVGPAQPWHAFFPLYPLAVRAVALLPGVSYAIAGIVVSMVAGAVATVVVWFLAARLTNPGTATRAAIVFAFFPGTIVFSMSYADSLGLALAAGCLLSLVNRRWLWAGALAGLATAARPDGLALCVACAWAAGEAIARRREWRSLLAPALSPAGMVAYFAYQWRHTGDARAWFTAEKAWHEHFDFGLNNLHRLHQGLFHPMAYAKSTEAALTIVFAAVALAVLLFLWRPPAVITVFTVAALIPGLTAYAAEPRPRYVLAAFPLLIGLARQLSDRDAGIVIGAEAVIAGALAVAVTGSVLLVP